MYNINEYSENDMYNILDLVNPTDRELEAKILSYIRKYENNEQTAELLKFFEDMYDYFFGESEEDEESEEVVDVDVEREGMESGSGKSASSIRVDQPSKDIGLIQQVGYSEDPLKLNQILKQTVTTLMTIDSQYRESTYPSSTNFSFNLSRPLRDVISLKLYSIQIPYAWWTINKNYGGNFFYLKGNSPGIDNGNHDYKIEIPPGNYTGTSITSTINSYLNDRKNSKCIMNLYTDVSFAGTYMEYNEANAISNIHVLIKKQYTETSYYIEFPEIKSTLFYNSIYDFLGYTYNTYDFNTITGATIKHSNSALNENIYTINSINDTIKIVYYNASSSNVYIDGSNSIGIYYITLPHSTNYNRDTVCSLLNSALNNHPNLSNSSITKNYDSSGNFYYDMTIQLNRYNVPTTAGAKVAIVFPKETGYYPVWTTANNNSAVTCCFSFAATEVSSETANSITYELSDLISENKPKVTNYIVPTDFSFGLFCTKKFYISSANNYYFDVSSSLNNVNGIYRGKYIISEYLAAINTSISNTNLKTYSVNNPTGVLNLTNTSSYLDPDTLKVNLKFDLNKTFTQDMFEMDLSSSFFHNRFNLPNYVTDLSGSISGLSVSSATYTVLSTNNKIYIKPAPSTAHHNGLDNRTHFEIVFTPGLYVSINTLIDMITDVLDNFEDEDGEHIFNQSSVTGEFDVYNNNMLKITLNIKMRKTLTENDYKTVFYTSNTDTAANYWLGDLKFDSSYVLSDYQNSAENSVYYSLISGTKNIDAVNFVIDSSNYIFYIKPLEEGVKSIYNDLSFVIPYGVYSREQIIDKLNYAFNNNALTIGSSVFINNNGHTVFRIFVNKLYTAIDYKLVFYDLYSFVRCINSGSTSMNATWDNTLGWLLGYKSNKEYPLNVSYENNTYLYDELTTEVQLGADSVLNVNNINYLLIVMDDYNQNYLNNSLVTVIGGENTIDTPSYTNFYKCSASVNGGVVSRNNTSYNSLTQNQIYSIQQIDDTNSRKSAQNIYTSGPNTKNIFAMIPLKTGGLKSGDYYSEYGGTLQNQMREYFGPVNIQRISVSVYTDRGQLLDLNGGNFTFTVLCEQLYNANSTRPGKKMT